MCGVRDHFQALFANRFAAGRTIPVCAFLDTVQGGVDLRNFQKGGAFESFKDLIRLGFGRLLGEVGVRGFAQVAFDLVDLIVQELKPFFQLCLDAF